MSGTDDLRDLLNRLKNEVGPSSELRATSEPGRRVPRPEPERPRSSSRQSGSERFIRAYRPEVRQEGRAAQSFQGSSWRENKEMLLFGMLVSLTVAFGGILAGLEYLILTGTVLLVLFSLAMLLLVLGYKRQTAEQDLGGLNERLDALSAKVESLGSANSVKIDREQVR